MRAALSVVALTLAFAARIELPVIEQSAGMHLVRADRGGHVCLREDSDCAVRPARYALEMNRGRFAERGINPGARLGRIEQPAPDR